jgi:hypothetical protein
MSGWLGIPYERADCVRLTRIYLRALGIRTRDPRVYPEAWEQVDQADAMVVTYRKRAHMAAIVGRTWALEARPHRTSVLIRLARLAHLGTEYWRPRQC